MKVLKPIECNEDMLTATNAVESYDEWLVTSSYTKGDVVYYGHYLYESLVNSNVGNDPSTDTINWVSVGTTNRCAMFDTQVSTQTITPTPLEVTITPNPSGSGTTHTFTALALLNMSATEVEVVVTTGAETLFSQTYSLDETVISNWYEYYFEPYQLRSDLVITGIPPSVSAQIDITISNLPSLNVAIGMVRFGNIYTLGDSEKGASLGITDYSVKETDSFGVTTFVERAFSKKLSANVFSLNANLLYITSVLQSLRATPTVWIYSERTELRPTLVYGFARDWNIDIAYTNYSLLSLEIEGLI